MLISQNIKTCYSGPVKRESSSKTVGCGTEGFSSTLWSVPTKSGLGLDNRWTSDRIMGTQGSLMCTGTGSWPVWTNSKDHLIVDCVAANQTKYPCQPGSNCKLLQWACEHHHWTTEQRRGPGLIDHIFFYIMCIAYLGKGRQQESRRRKACFA